MDTPQVSADETWFEVFAFMGTWSHLWKPFMEINAKTLNQVSSALMHYREALKVMTKETHPLAHARINTLIGATYASVASMPVQ